MNPTTAVGTPISGHAVAPTAPTYPPTKVGRPLDCDAEDYKNRNVVERAFNKLKNWRGLVKLPLLHRNEIVGQFGPTLDLTLTGSCADGASQRREAQHKGRVSFKQRE